MNKSSLNSINNLKTTDYLGRSYVWGLYRMLPDFGSFSIEIIDRDVTVDSLTFSRNTDDENGRKQLFELLGRHPDFYGNLTAEFIFGFGFELKVRVQLM